GLTAHPLRAAGAGLSRLVLPTRFLGRSFFRARHPWPSVDARAPGTAELARLHARSLTSTLGRPLISGNRVDVLPDGESTYAAMFTAIKAARDHVNVESYILEDDGPGAALAELLMQARARGVRVNVIFDSFGSLRTSADYFERLRKAGIALCEYNP